MGGSGFAVIAAALLAAQPATDAQTCEINFTADTTISELLRDRGFSFETYDRLCAALAQHGLELTMVGDSGAFADRASYGWASLSARRVATRARSDINYSSVSLNDEATTPAAADALYSAINNAANGIADDMAELVQSVEQEEARLRAAFSAQGRGGERPQQR